MSAHTPGPWRKFDGWSANIGIAAESGSIATVPRERGVMSDEDVARAEANAALITAAPELADEMERQHNSLAVVRLALGKNADPDLIKLIDEMRAGARAVLAKAGVL